MKSARANGYTAHVATLSSGLYCSHFMFSCCCDVHGRSSLHHELLSRQAIFTCRSELSSGRVSGLTLALSLIRTLLRWRACWPAAWPFAASSALTYVSAHMCSNPTRASATRGCRWTSGMLCTSTHSLLKILLRCSVGTYMIASGQSIIHMHRRAEHATHRGYLLTSSPFYVSRILSTHG